MRIFLDANIILDTYDNNRSSHKYSLILYRYVINKKFELFTSCDLITTIYYVNSKKDRKNALLNIQDINKTLKVIEFSNKEIEECCNLMLEDSNYKDLEDTIQYIMAKKEKCDLIISNDKNFISKDIKLMTSEEFCKANSI
ncbi:MAG: ribonuclease [Epsilonproteobacteria bacterium]|nr:MAG: ribonuclease [Campylobacterota bacterium]